LAGTNPERHLIGTRLGSFYQHAAATDAPEAHRLAATFRRGGHRSRHPDGVFERSGFTLHLVLLFRVVVWHVSAQRARLLDTATGV